MKSAHPILSGRLPIQQWARYIHLLCLLRSVSSVFFVPFFYFYFYFGFICVYYWLLIYLFIYVSFFFLFVSCLFRPFFALVALEVPNVCHIFDKTFFFSS